VVSMTAQVFPFHATMSGYLMQQAWGIPVQSKCECQMKNCFFKECLLRFYYGICRHLCLIFSHDVYNIHLYIMTRKRSMLSHHILSRCIYLLCLEYRSLTNCTTRQYLTRLPTRESTLDDRLARNPFGLSTIHSRYPKCIPSFLGIYFDIILKHIINTTCTYTIT